MATEKEEEKVPKKRRPRRKPSAEELEADELIDNLLRSRKTPEEVIGEGGLLQQLTKRLLERALGAELTDHVGYERGDSSGRNSGNSRNGTSAKMLKGTFGTMPIDIQRDRLGTFEPQLIG